MNFMFEWQEQCHENIKFISLSHRAIFCFIIWCPLLSHIADFTAFSNNRVLQQYGWASQKLQSTRLFSFSSLWENSFISSSLCKTNLPATATILNSKRCKKLTLFKGGKCRNRLPISDSLFHCSLQYNQVKNTPQNYNNEMIF